MLLTRNAVVVRMVSTRPGLQEIETEFGPALNYIEVSGLVEAGDRVQINCTATALGLGTGGYDFVIARLAGDDANNNTVAKDIARDDGHIVKLRYTPVQQAVRTLEEDPSNAAIWARDLAGFPVVVGQLHSQIAPVAAALTLRGCRCAYVMTDGAALPIAFSRLVVQLKECGMIATAITAGQSFGGDHETVTVHSALLAAAHLLGCDAAIVCQGPGNAGTGTRYGFSGIEQAALLDTVAALGGAPIAVARISNADARARHAGISHHTLTSLALVRSRCLAPLPIGTDDAGLSDRHDVRFIDGSGRVIDLLAEQVGKVTTMGRAVADDRIFFEAAAVAGLLAADIAIGNRQRETNREDRTENR